MISKIITICIAYSYSYIHPNQSP